MTAIPYLIHDGSTIIFVRQITYIEVDAEKNIAYVHFVGGGSMPINISPKELQDTLEIKEALG
jgi:hypothetical protein